MGSEKEEEGEEELNPVYKSVMIWFAARQVFREEEEENMDNARLKTQEEGRGGYHGNLGDGVSVARTEDAKVSLQLCLSACVQV